ncbi:MAG: hypothetical protein WD995_02065 [Gemmatimonadota bacterium]
MTRPSDATPGLLVRCTGAMLLAFAFLPIFRVVDVEDEAPVRAAILSMAELTVALSWWGSLSVVLVAFLLARLFPRVPQRIGQAVGSLLMRLPIPWFAIALGVLAALAALVLWTALYRGLYTNVDEMASMIQARYMAQGLLAGPVPPLPEGWLIPNTLIVGEGWVSQYPPSHLAVMAAFVLVGVPGLLGPVLIGVMAALIALTLPRLLPEHPAAARAAALLTALSPLLLFLAGGALSHLTAGAAVAAVAYAALRARDGHAGWACLTGAAVGIAVSARPLTGLLLGTVLPLSIWWPRVRAGALAWGLRRGVATVAGGLPFAAGLAWYHTRLFGGPTRWGYVAAFGEDHGLGFHPDPWGYMYGPVEALGFTSADLIAVGVQLLETPLPITAVVGCFLLLTPRLPRGGGVLLAWAVVPVLGNALYWFHAGRMYFEAAPAWIALGVLAVVAGSTSPAESGVSRGRVMGPLVAWSAVLALTWAIAGGIPSRWSNAAWERETLDRITIPEIPESGPALVFVHTSWHERLSATLQGAGGMRQDSVTSVLRRNTTCALDAYTKLREARARHGRTDVALPALDLTHRAGAPDDIERRRLGAGRSVRVREGEPMRPECLRELRADRFGSVALAPLLWQGDLPGDEHGRPMFVRDLGPEKNDRIRAVYPGRASFMFAHLAPDTPPRIAPYDEAMAILWGSSPNQDD